LKNGRHETQFSCRTDLGKKIEKEKKMKNPLHLITNKYQIEDASGMWAAEHPLPLPCI
jgi:hypothetical protein